MAATHKDSTVGNVIKNLCHSYGWCYGVFWRFDQPNSILLTMQDAYFEEQIQGLIDDLLPQSPIFGGGLIGQAALTKKHLWMSSKDKFTGQNSSGSIWDMFQDDSKFFRQFSWGVKTIAAIPVEPQGVVLFGSTNNILENSEFINRTKRFFDEIVTGNVPLSCSYSSNGLNGLYSSMISSEDYYSQTQSMFLDHNQSVTSIQPNVDSSLTSFSQSHQDMFDLPMDFGNMDDLFQTEGFNINDQFLSQPTWFPLDEQVNPLTVSGTRVDMFGNTGDLLDIVKPVIDENHSGRTSVSNSNPTQSVTNDAATLPPKNGLFSNLGIKELFEGISGISSSCVDDQVSSCSKRRKTATSLWETGSLQPVGYNKTFAQRSEPILKSEPWFGDGYSIDGSSAISQGKKPVEPTKPTKKKAKPGTRPRPKDRQMILDRMAELRELIPNGEKMSIDCLLDRTIKHMLFLQSVTKHADRIKQVDEPKHTGVTQNDYMNEGSNNGVTWACELGNQTMICPLIVEDLTTPGQMLIEMICEEHGFFLEIVDIIRGFGLTILKGVMESRDEKIWARFIVEAEAKRHVTRHEVFAALVHLLQTLGSNDNHLDKKIMQTGNSLRNDFHHADQIQLPVSLADTRYGMGL